MALLVVPPSKGSDCMAAHELSSGVLINTFLVIIEIFVYHQAHHHRTIHMNFFLHFLPVCFYFHAALLAIVLLVGLLFIVTPEGAFLELLLIGHTLLGRDSLCHQEVNSRHHVASQAAIIFKITVDHVLS